MSKLSDFRDRGCTCGLDDEHSDPVRHCPVHEPGDNRGLRAWFEDGMPLGFPSKATCAVCGADGLMYPDVDLDDKTKPFVHTPTLICPRCSTPGLEARRRQLSEDGGYVLNAMTVFGVAA